MQNKESIIDPIKHCPPIPKKESDFENGRRTTDNKNHRIIGLRNLAKASAAQKQFSKC